MKNRIKQFFMSKVGTVRNEDTVKSSGAKYQIENIDTKIGNDILKALRKNKWKIVSQYSLLAFDKGIDFDFYRLKKSDEKLYFEWDNWFEWKIIGSQQLVKKLANKYSLKHEVKPDL